MGTSKDGARSAPAHVPVRLAHLRLPAALRASLLSALRGNSPALSVTARSQAIDFARITLIVGLVCLHYGQFPNSDASPHQGMDVLDHPLATYVNSLVVFFFFSVVPLLSMISGYLFFSFADDAPRQLAQRIRGRFRSLYVPLVIWNSGYIGVLLLLSAIVPDHGFINEMNIDLKTAGAADYVNAIFGVTAHPVGFQFWFVRDLFVTVLCSPVLWLLIRRAPLLGTLGLGLVWLSGSTLGIFFRTDVLFFFYVGGLLRASGTRLEIGTKATLVLGSLYLTLVAVRAAVPAFYEDAHTGLAHNVLMAATRGMRLVGVLACWGAVLRIAPTALGRAVGTFGGLAFFLHAAHFPLLAEIKILLWPHLPAQTDGWMLIHYAASIVSTVAIGIVAGVVLARKAPSVFALFNGGRALGPNTQRFVEGPDVAFPGDPSGRRLSAQPRTTMISCCEFRFLAGARPREMTWSQWLHWIMCRACGRFLREMRELDRRIEKALAVDPPALSHRPRRPSSHPGR